MKEFKEVGHTTSHGSHDANLDYNYSKSKSHTLILMMPLQLVQWKEYKTRHKKLKSNKNTWFIVSKPEQNVACIPLALVLYGSSWLPYFLIKILWDIFRHHFTKSFVPLYNSICWNLGRSILYYITQGMQSFVISIVLHVKHSSLFNIRHLIWHFFSPN